MMQAATGGYLKSTTHRVVRSAGCKNPRFSIPLFIGAQEDIMLTPTLKAGDYFVERMKENGVYAVPDAA
jgi:isopenicillin N synthase-like dioxygenase